MIRHLLLILPLLLLPAAVCAERFTLEKKSAAQPGPTVLVIGGIHGDEPGGFNAAALLQTRYQLHSGNLWIVPDLNRTSILRRVHGWFGDMNYKFNGIHKSDPDYPIVQQIKQLIRDPQVDLVVNLHDGSGFFSPTYQNPQRNPQRWGQSCVIDQAELAGVKIGQLASFCGQLAEQVNRQLLQPGHRFLVKNTDTANSNAAMHNALTYFAIRNQKPAIGLEASKALPTHQRVYYLLSTLEAAMQQVGIDFSRDLPLTPQAVKRALTEDIKLRLAEGRIELTLTNMRPELNHFPLEKGKSIDYQSANPLVSVRQKDDRYRIHFGNNRLAFLNPEYLEYDRSLSGITVELDGQTTPSEFGESLQVNRTFQARVPSDYRVNLIGYQHPRQSNEAGLEVSRQQFDRNYSVDNDGRIFRVEVYRGDKFCGMLLVEFTAEK